jgi:predicted flap endonuclease-1-like 5' DNA nuclease
MRGTEYAILEIVWWMLAAGAVGFLIGWTVRRFFLQRNLEREYQAKLGNAHEQAAHLREELNEWKLSVSALDKRLTKAGGDISTARAEAAENTAALETRTRELKEAQTIAERQQSTLDELQSEVASVRSERDSAIENSNELESTVERLRRDLETAQQIAGEAEHRHGVVIEEKDAEIARLAERADATASLESELEERIARITDLEGRLEEAELRLRDLQDELDTAKKDHSEYQIGLEERDERIAELETQLAVVPQEQVETLSEMEERDERIAELEAQLSAAIQDQADSAAELHERDERIAQLEAGLNTHREPVPKYPDRDTAIIRMAEIARRTRGSFPLVNDDLQMIHGIGPRLEQLLKSFGITSFRQVANFQTDDIAYISAALSAFPGRIERDNWMASAAELHREKYGHPA